MGIKQQKRVHTQIAEAEKPQTIAQSPSKKLKKMSGTVAPAIDVGTTLNTQSSEAQPMSAKQQKRQKAKARKMAAIAAIKEKGGVPKPLHPTKKDKALRVQNRAQGSTVLAQDKKLSPQKSESNEKEQPKKNAKLQAKLEKKNQLRKEKRQQVGQYKPEQITLSPEEIKQKIEEIKSRGELTKTAKRKLAILKRKLGAPEATAGAEPSDTNKTQEDSSKSKNQKSKQKKKTLPTSGDVEMKESDPDAEKPVDIQHFEKKKLKKNQIHENQPVTKPAQKKLNQAGSKIQEQNKIIRKPENLNGKKKQGKGETFVTNKKQVVEKNDEDDDDDDDDDDEVSADESENEIVASLNNKGKGNMLSAAKNYEDDDDDDDDDGDDDDDDEAQADEAEEDDDDEDNSDEVEKNDAQEQTSPIGNDEDESDSDDKKALKKPKLQMEKSNKNKTVKTNLGKPQQQVQNQENPEKKKRFVLFVGNLPYDAKPEDIKQHFLTKIDEVTSVRIPNQPGTQTPRGIGFVEVTNAVDYEKALSLNHSFLSGRRINVQYTLSGSKDPSNRQEVVSKNKKLDAMRKAGKLAGSQKHDQKRSVRRFQQRNQPRR